MMSTIFARWLTEINSFSFKSNLLEISFGTRTLNSDLLQKITETVVECSCVVKKIVGKDAIEKKENDSTSVSLYPAYYFSSAASL